METVFNHLPLWEVRVNKEKLGLCVYETNTLGKNPHQGFTCTLINICLSVNISVCRAPLSKDSITSQTRLSMGTMSSKP